MPKPAALIVSHGQPSDPAPAEAALADFAARIAVFLPGWHVAAATLATPGALEAALHSANAASQPEGAGPGTGLVYPMFMTGGWFTNTHLPERLAQAGAAMAGAPARQGWAVMEPFGTDPGVQALTVALARGAIAGRDPASVQMLLAAHGSSRSTAASEVAQAMAAKIARETGLGRVEAAFIDQSPRIVDVAASFAPGAICLPFFAAAGGHVLEDLPQAVQGTVFEGGVLPPVGLDPAVPELIAAALRRAWADRRAA